MSPKKDLSVFTRHYVNRFFEAILNVVLFFPYFFSVQPLLKTLFLPWKNIIAKKTTRGFSFGELMSRMFFNLISSGIGFVMRCSIILFYLILQSLYVIALPFIIIFFFLTIPVRLLVYRFEKTEEEKKDTLKKQFVSTHLLDPKNSLQVYAWFESYYSHHVAKQAWWSLSNLLSIPPLARDWAVGYTPILDEYSEELTNGLYQSRIQTIVGRKKEIELLEEALMKTHESNALIVGEEGVGKHTIVDALAKLIYEGRANPILAYKRILKLNLEKILTVYTDTQQREHFLEELFKEAADAKNLILLIENIDRYVAYGQGRIDLSISIEKYAKSGRVQFIGISSPFFYQRFIFNNDKISRLFTKVDVSEISPEEATKTLLDTLYLYESRNNVIVPYETVLDTIDKSEFYITSIPFPEKAFSLLDHASAYVSQRRAKNDNLPIVIKPEVIDTVLSEKTHIPTHLNETMKTKLINLEKLLCERVLFQDEAISSLAAAMRRSFILLGKRKKPLATFLFLGPTGVGKTETAKALADIFFGGGSFLLRFDMSLYQSKDDIKTLIGSIESGIPGLLTKAVREQPYAVLLLDEIEKADKDLLNIFLTLLDEGYFTDGFGKRVDCKNIIVIATSNAGADYIFAQQSAPSSSATVSTNDLIAHLVSQHLFSPEFLNRFDGVVTYHPVTEKTILALAQKMTSSIAQTIKKMYGLDIRISEATLGVLVKEGYNPAFGARNLERTITTQLEDKIAKLILENKTKEGEIIVL